MEYQINAVSRMPYQGKNQGELISAKQKNNFESNEWLTFLQAKQIGRTVKKGSKSVSVFKGFGQITKPSKDGKTKIESAPLGFANVFNLDQTEELTKIIL